MLTLENKRSDKIKDLLDEALALSPSERESFLDKNCEDDPVLKKEAISLLKSLETTEDFLEKYLDGENKKEDTFTDNLIGKNIGSYLIEGIAGRGGMGVVYRGIRNDDEFDHKVAIKIIGYGLNSEYLLKRFQIERQTLANLQHPNITRLLDGGRTAEGLPFLVMEYIEGIPITKYAVQNKLNIEDRLKIFLKVCEAVQYAHQNLIIHRDIKPGNILVNNLGIPKLLDFGIAKIMDENLLEGNEVLTRTNLLNFTPEFASPEQILGEKITTSSDIYSLGVLLYNLLTDSLPYRFKGTSITSLSKIISDEDYLKPSEAVQKKLSEQQNQISQESIKPEILCKKLKGDLDKIVLKSMHNEPARRYRSVEQLAEDIRRYLSGLPVLAQGDSKSYIFLKFIQRHKAGVLSTTLFLLLLITSVIIIVWQANLTKIEMNKAKIEAIKAEKVSMFLQKMISSADPYEVGRDVKVYDVVEKASHNVGKEFKEEPKVEAAIHSTLGNTFTNLGEYKEAKDHLLKALKLNEENYGTNSNETAGSLHDLALYYHWTGELRFADSLYNKADYIFRKTGSKPGLGMETNLNDYATLQTDLGNYEKAKKMLLEDMQIAINIKGFNSYETATVMNNLAIALDYLKDLKGAEEYYLKAQKIDRNLYGENSPTVASTYNNLAFIYSERNELQKAKDYFMKSFEMKKALLGKDHPDVGLALNNLGCIEIKLKNYKAAKDYLEKSVIQLRKTYPEDHFWIGRSYYWLGLIHNETGDYGTAEMYLKKSLSIREKNYPKGNSIIFQTEGELGISYLNQNELKNAEKYLLDAYNGYVVEDSNLDDNSIRIVQNIITLYKKNSNSAEVEKYSEILKNIQPK